MGGTWRLYDSGNNARPLNVGQSGTGTLNIKQKGHVDGGYLRLGSSTRRRRHGQRRGRGLCSDDRIIRNRELRYGLIKYYG
ncbi:hypothetical protein ACLK2A_08325 [Escherichia coli]